MEHDAVKKSKYRKANMQKPLSISERTSTPRWLRSKMPCPDVRNWLKQPRIRRRSHSRRRRLNNRRMRGLTPAPPIFRPGWRRRAGCGKRATRLNRTVWTSSIIEWGYIRRLAAKSIFRGRVTQRTTEYAKPEGRAARSLNEVAPENGHQSALRLAVIDTGREAAGTQR